MRTVFAAALLAAASATPGLAQDPAPAGNFAGGHLELLFGLDRTQGDTDIPDPVTGDDDINANGALVGISGGWDFQTGGMVFGIEAEASDSTADFCDPTGCLESGRDLYIGGRIGGVVSDQVLIYVKGGYTNARAILEDAAGDTVDGTNLDGIRGGVGLEWATGTPLVARLEYRYSNYEAGVSRHQGVLGLGLRF